MRVSQPMYFVDIIVPRKQKARGKFREVARFFAGNGGRCGYGVPHGIA